MSLNRENIVISGAALVSGLGLTRDQTWQAILHGRCAMGPMSAMETPLPPEKDGGQAPELPGDFAPDLPREARYLKWTVADALRDGGMNDSPLYPANRCVSLLGTTLHGMRAAGKFLRTGDYSAFRQFLAGSTLQMSIDRTIAGGLTATICSACSSSLGSIAMGVTLLQTGQADMVIAGGYDPVSEYVYAGFSSLRLVADGPLRPFALNRKGMKLAEGYGVVILERTSDAIRRGKTPLATVVEWGESADAHHLTQPDPRGDGAARAIEQAMARAQATSAGIDLIAAHATGTHDNDAGEYQAFSRALGDRLPQIPVVGFKSHLGHTLGAAGVIELILSAMAMRDQIIPGCANVRAGEVEFPGLRLATGAPHRAHIRRTLNTSLGFGGANTCVILGPGETLEKPNVEPRGSELRTVGSPLPPPVLRGRVGEGAQRGASRNPLPTLPRNTGGGKPIVITPAIDAPVLTPAVEREVFITGVGVVLPGIIGNEAWVKHLKSNEPPAWEHDAGAVKEADLQGLLNARRVRRMSDYVKVTLAAATLACRDAGIDDLPAFAADCAAILGTMHGSVIYSTEYYTQIVKDGMQAANPMLFAESVPNAGAAQLSLMLSLKGACQSVIGSRTAGLDAMSLATARIRNGDWDRAIVGAGEEYSPLVNDAYRHCGVGAVEGCAPFSAESGFVTGAGAVLFVLESRQSMEGRGGKPRARIEGTAAGSGDPGRAIPLLAGILNSLGNPSNILSSACGTWIDRAEEAAIRHSKGARLVSSIYGHAAETFSVSPLAALSAVIFSRKMPALRGGGWSDDNGVRAASGDEPIESVAALCTDFSGAVSGIRIGLI